MLWLLMLACASEPTFGPTIRSTDEACVDGEVAVLAPAAALYQAETSADDDVMLIHYPLPVRRTDEGMLLVDCDGGRVIVTWVEP